MLVLADKDIKIVIITILRIFKKLEKRLEMLYRDMEDIKKKQNQISGDENYNVWDEMYTG